MAQTWALGSLSVSLRQELWEQPAAGCVAATPAGFSNCSGLFTAQLKPIYARYGRIGKNDGSMPVVFADSDAKSMTAASLNSFGKVLWRFR